MSANFTPATGYKARNMTSGKQMTVDGSCEFYTPEPYIELVREVLGEIDIDPASHPIPQTWIKAKTFWTEADDSQYRSWAARTVYLNPPFGKTTSGESLPGMWSQKMIHEYRVGNFQSGILLVNSVPGYNWYEELLDQYPACSVRERICFIRPDGTPGRPSVRGQSFVYFGQDIRRFKRVFSQIGRVLLPEPKRIRFSYNRARGSKRCEQLVTST